MVGIVLLAVPLLVALVRLHGTSFDPPWDDALTEMRVRDVTAGHPELVGAYTRFVALGTPGSHPGPAMFFMLAPGYALLGSTPWALTAAAVLSTLLAIGLLIWVVSRRGGPMFVLVALVAVAVVMHALGPELLTRPWNPYFPLFWWFLFLTAIWSVLDGDVPMLVVATVAGTVCVQAHNSYIGLVGGLTVVGFAVVAWRWWRARGDRPARRHLLVWSAAAVGAALVVWLPAIIDELTRHPGNLSVTWEYFTNYSGARVGLRSALETLCIQSNPWRLVNGDIFFDTVFVRGSIVPGLLLLSAWGASFVAAAWWAWIPGSLRALHRTVGVTLVLEVVSVARIPGALFWYLNLWGWITTMLVIVSLVWTVTLVLTRWLRRDATEPIRAARALVVLLCVLGVTAVAALTVDVTHTELDRPDETLRAVLGPTLRGLAPVSKQRPVVVVWTELALGGPGRELVNELDRRGYRVGALRPFTAEVTRRHTFTPGPDSIGLAIAVGPDRQRWAAQRGARRIGSVRTADVGPVDVFLADAAALRAAVSG